MKEWKRRIAIIILCCMILGPLLSMEYLTKYIHHDCSGKGCTVCTQLEIACQNLINSRIVLKVIAFSVMIILFQISYYLIRSIISLMGKTLITLNVELLE